jgi:hypothetical protein
MLLYPYQALKKTENFAVCRGVVAQSRLQVAHFSWDFQEKGSFLASMVHPEKIKYPVAVS